MYASLHKLIAACWIACSLLVSPVSSGQPILLNNTLPEAVFGQLYTANLMVAGTPPPTSVTVSGLPTGLTAVQNGSGSIAISGTATQAGAFSVVINATNSGGNISPIVSLTVQRYAAVSSVAWDGDTLGCAVVEGGVQCFGEGFVDATGTSTATALQPKQLIAAGSGATFIAGSLDESAAYPYFRVHHCAVINGGVRCWGNNTFGQLGNNSTTDSTVPVEAIPAGSNVVAVAVGVFNNEFGQRVVAVSCAIADGGLQCWGHHGSGAAPSSLTPVWVIPRNSNVTSLSLSYGHWCVVVNGGVRCGGAVNPYGAFGGGSVFPSGSGATSVAAGLGHSCAALDGGVQCWGNNAYGQLGYVTQYDRSTTPAQAIAPGSGVTALVAGQVHTCALINMAQFCWGSGFGVEPRQLFAETGRLSPIDRITGAVIDGLAVAKTTLIYASDYGGLARRLLPAQAMPAGSGVQSLAAGLSHTCALANGGVRCWGVSDFRLGALDKLDLVRGYGFAEAIGVGGGVTSIFSNTSDTCAVANGGVLCWGGGYAPGYILGAGGGATAAAFWSSVYGGGGMCYVIDGGVVCKERTLDNAGTGYLDVLTQKIPVQSSVTGIATTLNSGCALALGGVKCWGRNYAGQLGDGTTNDSETPVQTIPAGAGATAVAAGFWHVCAVIGGGVQCWGQNNYGQLGDGSGTPNSLAPVQAIAPGSGVTTITAARGHTCATVSGGVRCWGWNEYGQLGNNTLVDSAVPVQAIPSGAGAASIAAGDLHTCAVVNTGVQCWGSNYWSQLADPSTAGIRKRYLQLPAAQRARVLDVDQNQPLAQFSALTDGRIILRYMMGLTGAALTQGALSPNSTRVDPALVKAYLDFIRAHLDIDGNGTIDAETDGVLLLRYLLGFRGQPLLDGAVSAVGLPARATPQAIEAYLASLMLQ